MLLKTATQKPSDEALSATTCVKPSGTWSTIPQHCLLLTHTRSHTQSQTTCSIRCHHKICGRLIHIYDNKYRPQSNITNLFVWRSRGERTPWGSWRKNIRTGAINLNGEESGCQLPPERHTSRPAARHTHLPVNPPRLTHISELK